MKQVVNLFRKNHHYLWLVAAGFYSHYGNYELVIPMMLLFIVDDVFNKIDEKINS